MEEDGVLIWVGYAGVIGNVVYFGAVVASANLILRHWAEWYEAIMNWLRSWT
jgi:hypothetical protein